jgi:hypothetical protein
MRKKQLLLVGFIILLLTGPSTMASQPLEMDVVLSDDAYHYKYFADGLHDWNYIEWWYFNFFDAEKDIQVIFSYSIVDPDNYTSLAQAGVTAIVFTPEGIIQETDTFPTDMFSASYEQADVQIAHNTVEVIDVDTYRIIGSIGDGRISWDLTYVRQAGAWFGGDREQIGVLPWEQMSWLIYMPGAYVTGEIQVNNQTYVVDNVPGYHDHNWGEWVPSNVMFNWAQYFEPGLTLDLGDFPDKPAGTLSIEYLGDRTTFSKEQYRLVHTRWEFDPRIFRFFPVESWLLAMNETKMLVVSMKALDTEALQVEIPFSFIPNTIIFEQTARYKGGLWEKCQDGKWEALVLFNGKGFKEYTARKWVTVE